MLLALLGLCAVAVLLIVLLPISGELHSLLVWLNDLGERLGIPPGIGLGTYDFGLNIILFAVPTALAAALWPQVRRWRWVVGALVVSVLIETVQGMGLPRTSSVSDVVANTLGAVVGLWVLGLIRRRRRPEVSLP